MLDIAFLSNYPDFTRYDIAVTALTVHGEAAGEPYEGKVAVAWIIRRRVVIDLHGDGKPDWWGEGYADVCLKPKQFSCWNGLGKDKLLKVTFLTPGFRDCLLATCMVMNDVLPDNVNKADHYMNLDRRSQGWPSSWGPVKQPVAKIGNHLFYRLYSGD
jgi:hypothetical protein